MTNIMSPITLRNNTTFIKSTNKKQIIREYMAFGIDVSMYFVNIKYISIYRCNDSGYFFYYPYNLAGDSKFYEFFSKFDWYYMPWKWEHELAEKYIKPEFKVLDVGCGHGAFIKKINENIKLLLTIGLELNRSAVEKGDKYQILNESIQSYSVKNKDCFDLVCSFQVLEHVTDVNDFIKSSLFCLKKGGTFIISVPNNESYIKELKKCNCLNMPPHHMGLWNKDSLSALSEIFHLKILNVHFEDLQVYHIDSYILAKYYIKFTPIARKIIIKGHKLIGIYQRRYKKIMNERHSLVGQTILIAFEKL